MYFVHPDLMCDLSVPLIFLSSVFADESLVYFILICGKSIPKNE